MAFAWLHRLLSSSSAESRLVLLLLFWPSDFQNNWISGQITGQQCCWDHLGARLYGRWDGIKTIKREISFAKEFLRLPILNALRVLFQGFYTGLSNQTWVFIFVNLFITAHKAGGSPKSACVLFISMFRTGDFGHIWLHWGASMTLLNYP